MRPSAIIAVVLCLTAPPLLAQTVDFGTDSSKWANDGECDDPRFEGPGMTQTTLLDTDILADATDCRTAFEAGTISVVGGPQAAPATLPPELPAPADVAAQTPAQTPAPTSAQTPAAQMAGSINFGDDSGEWANDGECDDRRFVGVGMATGLSWLYVGRDATDCRSLHESGSIRLWNWTEAVAATQCAAIDFGDDSGDYPNDGECDDVRFEGLAAASTIVADFVGRDATDCLQLCAFGVIALRDY